MRKLNIAIIGLGNIGSYLFKYLNDNNEYETLFYKNMSNNNQKQTK